MLAEITEALAADSVPDRSAQKTGALLYRCFNQKSSSNSGPLPGSRASRFRHRRNPQHRTAGIRWRSRSSGVATDQLRSAHSDGCRANTLIFRSPARCA